MATGELSVCEAVDREAPDVTNYVARRLREIGEPRRARTTARTWPGVPRIRDILLSGPVEDEAECRILNRRLDREFSEEGLEFRVRGAWVRDAPPRAFFGLGVFAPDADDQPVADLQFAWKAQPDIDEVVTPQLGANRSDPPAAWYPGQLGVALGFDRRWAPALISRRGASPNTPVVAALQDVVLFFGRRQTHSAPVVEAHVRGETLAPDSVAHFLEHEDWWLRNGEWQGMELRIENLGTVRLWFRLASRTGRIHFRSAPKSRRGASPEPPADRKARPLVIVRGLVLPSPPSLPQLFTGFLGGRASRIVVDFDGQNRLRTNEISETRSSVVVDRGSRLAVWRHAPPGSWIDRSRSLAGWQDLELDDGERVALHDFPPTWPRETAPDRRKAMRALYRRGAWCLLQFDGEETSFGWFALGPRGVLSEGTDGDANRTEGESGETPKISLDWLNRAGHVVRGGTVYGLAKHYFEQSKVRTTVTVAADGLEVEVGRGALGFVRYKIGPGELGPLGPLYVEYRPG